MGIAVSFPDGCGVGMFSGGSAGAPSANIRTPRAGLLYAFGEHRSGELGNTTNYNTMEPNATPTPVELPPASGTVVQAAAGQLAASS